MCIDFRQWEIYSCDLVDQKLFFTSPTCHDWSLELVPSSVEGETRFFFSPRFRPIHKKYLLLVSNDMLLKYSPTPALGFHWQSRLPLPLTMGLPTLIRISNEQDKNYYKCYTNPIALKNIICCQYLIKSSKLASELRPLF